MPTVPAKKHNNGSVVDAPIPLLSRSQTQKDIDHSPIVRLSSTMFSNSSRPKNDNATHDAGANNAYCETPPGDAVLVDGGRMGYQVLKRMQYFLQTLQVVPATAAAATAATVKKQQPTVLCLLIDFSEALQIAALETYGPYCDGIVLSPPTKTSSSCRHPTSKTRSNNCNDNKNRDTATWKIVNVARNETKVLPTGSNYHVFRSLLELPFTWVHWAVPDRYVVPEFLRFLLRSIDHHPERSTSTNTTGTTSLRSRPTVLESWVIDDPGQPAYTGLYGEKESRGCEYPRTFNMQTVNLLANKCSDLSELAKASNLTMWMESCLAMYKPKCQRAALRKFKEAPWLYLLRYYEIQLPASNNSTASVVDDNDESYNYSMRRYHAILHGHCDANWDRSYGALDKDGTPGYIHDPTLLKRNPLPFTYHTAGEKEAVCDIAPGKGEEGPAGYRGLTKIQRAAKDEETAPASARTRVLCMVYTHSSRHERLRSVAETWGSHCDGFFAASDQTDASIGAVHLLHEGPEHYQNMWLKVHAMWRYVYDHYLEDYDFFHIGGDDHYVIAENLRYTASTGSWKGPWNQSEPLYLGGSLPLGSKRRYCNGGSGYTLNQVALKMLVEDLFPTPRCWPHWQASDEDKIIASCFRAVGIQCMDTNDDRNETRYHTWHVDQHADWSIGKPAQDWAHLPKYHGIAWKEGMGQISETSVSFHLKKKEVRTIDSGMRRYHAILYGLCGNETNLVVARAP